jgi:hypothetical protein
MHVTPEYLATLNPQQLLELWHAKTIELEKAKQIVAEEQMIRGACVRQFFGEHPAEGTNSLDLTDGYVLKATVQYTRTVDKAAFLNIADQLRELIGPKVDEVVRWKPELATGEFRKLQGDAAALLNSVITTKSGLAGMEIVLPKRNRGK